MGRSVDDFMDELAFGETSMDDLCIADCCCIDDFVDRARRYHEREVEERVDALYF